jgi:flagellar biosynthesis protein FliR
MVNLLDTQILLWISSWFLPFVRILGLISTAPILSSRNIPARAKIALAALLAIMVLPFLAPVEGLTLASPSAWGVLIREMFIGMAIGFLARLVLLVFEIAGELIGLQIGLSYAGYFSPGSGHGNAIGSFAGILASWMFVTLNGPVLLLSCVIHSYEKLPVGMDQMNRISLDPNRIFGMMSDIFAMSLVLALPVVTLILLINFAMGVATKVAPQLNLFAVGFPILILCGLGMLSVIMPAFEPTLIKGLEAVFSMW